MATRSARFGEAALKAATTEPGNADAALAKIQAVLDPLTLRSIPWEPGVAAILADFRDADGNDHPACPRSLLRRVIERANKMGFAPKFGSEYEFFVFQETRDTLEEKGFRNLLPLDPGMFGYSWVRTGQDAELMRDILDSMRDFDIPIEGLHTETGPGVYEVAIQYGDALVAADQAALFKVAMKQIAHEHGLSVFTWTLRPENRFLAPGHRVGAAPADWGDWRREFELILSTGIDGIFADHADLAVAARDGI